ncbi:MAG: NADH-quinone oxidoreductase subunit M, partial [Verrucomicrobiota bacterium]|nr:NADH-quinone oxidoreductase subunit M [Verrucomicrobiota bacterium]
MIAWTIYITFAGALLSLFAPRSFAKNVALSTTLAGFFISLWAFCTLDEAGVLTTVVRVPWVPVLGMEYHLAADGISLTL